MMIPSSDNDFDTLDAKTSSFFRMTGLRTLLRTCGMDKEKGISALAVFRFIFSTIFTGMSVLRRQRTEKDAPGRNTVARFLSSEKADWNRLSTLSAKAVIDNVLAPVHEAEERGGRKVFRALVVDDSPLRRDRSEKVELLSVCHDHARHECYRGFRMATLGYSDGRTFLPLAHTNMASQESGKRICGARDGIGKGTAAARRRETATGGLPNAALEMIRGAKDAGIDAPYVLMDSWFVCPKMIFSLRTMGCDLIGMVRRDRTRYNVGDRMLTLREIYRTFPKRRGMSRYLLSVEASARDGEGTEVPLRFVFLRNRAKRKDWLCLVTTDMSLTEDEVIRAYSQRWSIECFFKFAKQRLEIVRRCNALSYDAITANNAIAFIQYQMLACEQRVNDDERTLGELFVDLMLDTDSDRLAAALSVFMSLFADEISRTFRLDEKAVEAMVREFCSKLPELLSSRLKCSA